MCSPQIAFAMRSMSGNSAGLWRVIVASPCRNALRLALDLPAAVRGPRLFLTVDPVGSNLFIGSHASLCCKLLGLQFGWGELGVDDLLGYLAQQMA